ARPAAERGHDFGSCCPQDRMSSPTFPAWNEQSKHRHRVCKMPYAMASVPRVLEPGFVTPWLIRTEDAAAGSGPRAPLFKGCSACPAPQTDATPSLQSAGQSCTDACGC